MLPEVPRHAGSVPPHVTPALMTGPLGVMNHLHLGANHDRMTRFPQTGADVDIFVVKEKFFVKPADDFKVFSTEEHKHACHPVHWCYALIGLERITSIMAAK